MNGHEWNLRRNCCLAPRQLAAVFASLAAVCFAIAGFFWVMGAPLVLMFAGVEVLALAAAFVLYARRALDGERVVLEAQSLRVECSQAGITRVVRFNPRWVRVEVEEAPRFAVRLGQSDRALQVGRFANEQSLREFVAQLNCALRPR